MTERGLRYFAAVLIVITVILVVITPRPDETIMPDDFPEHTSVYQYYFDLIYRLYPEGNHGCDSFYFVFNGVDEEIYNAVVASIAQNREVQSMDFKCAPWNTEPDPAELADAQNLVIVFENVRYPVARGEDLACITFDVTKYHPEGYGYYIHACADLEDEGWKRYWDAEEEINLRE